MSVNLHHKIRMVNIPNDSICVTILQILVRWKKLFFVMQSSSGPEYQRVPEVKAFKYLKLKRIMLVVLLVFPLLHYFWRIIYTNCNEVQIVVHLLSLLNFTNVLIKS